MTRRKIFPNDGVSLRRQPSAIAGDPSPSEKVAALRFDALLSEGPAVGDTVQTADGPAVVTEIHGQGEPGVEEPTYSVQGEDGETRLLFVRDLADLDPGTPEDDGQESPAEGSAEDEGSGSPEETSQAATDEDSTPDGGEETSTPDAEEDDFEAMAAQAMAGKSAE